MTNKRANKYLVQKKSFIGTYKNCFGSGQSYAPWRTIKSSDTEAEARAFYDQKAGLDKYQIKYGKTVIATK